MKKNKLTTAVIAGLAGVAGMANAAVHVSSEGTGQVLIYPYYTVNNGLNTTYSVVNTTNETKAVKVRFLEGDHSLEVLDFNVYLSPYDVWTGAVLPSTSTIGMHSGEANAQHVTYDTSCAPFLEKSGQEFLPYEIDRNAFIHRHPVTGAIPNNDMERATQGHFEVIEMATITGDHADAILHASQNGQYTTAGVPISCGAIAASWSDGGDWTLSGGAVDTDLPTGGLFGAATILNVAEGLAMTYDAIAIDDFWAPLNSGHTEPGDYLPSLASADEDATVFIDGVAASSNWNFGYESISSLFMKQSIFNEYAFDAAIAAKSEWVVTFPTKRFHVNIASPEIAPFTNYWNGFRACEEFSLTIWDREEQVNAPGAGVVSPRPPAGSNPSLCHEANVVQFLAPGESAGDASKVLGGTNLVTLSGVQVPHATENGWAKMSFNEVGHVMTPDSGTGYRGLPVTGFMVQQYTNANAAPGLMAQYAGLFNHKGEIISF